MPPAARVYRLLKFLKLALVLIAYLLAGAALASLIPQNRPPAFYLERYPALVPALVPALGLDHFFRSPLFLVPALLLFVNLLFCSLERLRARVSPAKGPSCRSFSLILDSGCHILKKQSF